MRKLLFAGALALPLLAGCATVEKIAAGIKVAKGTSISQKQAATAVQSFDLAETGATAYLRLPTCKTGQAVLTNACRAASGSASKVIADVRAGRAARDSLWNTSKASPDGSVNVAGGLYEAVVQITTTLNSETGAGK